MHAVATLSIKTSMWECDLLAAISKWEDILFVMWTLKWGVVQSALQSMQIENFSHLNHYPSTVFCSIRLFPSAANVCLDNPASVQCLKQTLNVS